MTEAQKGKFFEGESVSEGERYPVHFQQHARLSLRISIVGVGEARAVSQDGPPEATGFLCHALSVILHEILSFGAFLVILLFRIIIS